MPEAGVSPSLAAAMAAEEVFAPGATLMVAAHATLLANPLTIKATTPTNLATICGSPFESGMTRFRQAANTAGLLEGNPFATQELNQVQRPLQCRIISPPKICVTETIERFSPSLKERLLGNRACAEA